MDEVTQMEVVVSVEKISERYLIPAPEHLLQNLPFVVQGFHSDKGSEYINKRVAKLLDKLRIEFTQSRSRKSNDNALAEGKNAHVLRKLFGHGHIPQRWTSLINDFRQQYLNPYINDHQPCLFPETITDDKGRERKRYPYSSLKTPYQKLKSLPNAQTCLKPGVTFEILDSIAQETTRCRSKACASNHAEAGLLRIQSALKPLAHAGSLICLTGTEPGYMLF